MKIKKILIVDDSAFMRKVISDIFQEAEDFDVLGTARNGEDAINKIKANKPDVITLDVEMPVMDGIAALEYIMKECPVPVVMVSSVTTEGADATIKSLSLGAVDFVTKTKGAISAVDDIKEEILSKCRVAANVNVALLKTKPQIPFKKEIKSVVQEKVLPALKTTEPQKTLINKNLSKKIIVIGTSTGGPRALQEVLTKLPVDFPCPILIVQHMPAGFTKSLSERLDALSNIKVKEASDGDVLQNGCAYIAPGNYHMLLKENTGVFKIVLNQDKPVSNHRPAIDPMIYSAVELYKNNTIGVILTGMGQDGAEGIKKIKEHGGITIAESKETAVVYGMPRVPNEWGVVDTVSPIQDVAKEIMKAVVLKK